MSVTVILMPHKLVCVCFLCLCVYPCSPLKLLNRHNEVWYVAEGDPVCVVPEETPTATPTAGSKQ